VEDVAGYRVLRSVGRGDRARLVLGFDEARTVVLKITRGDDPCAAVEIEALARAAGDHVVELHDIATDGTETVLVLERLPNGTLAELHERRSGLDAGEAVTILAPIAAAIDRIHGSGVAHGRLSLGAIGFRADGAPTLTGFGGAELFPEHTPEVVRETVAGVAADRAALAAIAAAVLGRVVGAAARNARDLAAGLTPIAPGELADRVFALAAATPVRFIDDTDAVAVRLGEPQDVPEIDDAPRGGIPWWLTPLLPEWMRHRISEPAERVLTIWSAWEPRRRRIVLGTFAGGLALVGALALVPASPVASSVAEPIPTPSGMSGTSGTSAAEAWLPDDPVEAAVVLLEQRERCLRDLSVLCLDAVVQPGSAAYTDDVALIRGVQAGGEYPPDELAEGSPVLVERLGDAALLDLPPGSHPGSVLLLQTANGWRIRDYLDAPAVSVEPESGAPD
jgi:hypothetical protein